MKQCSNKGRLDLMARVVMFFSLNIEIYHAYDSSAFLWHTSPLHSGRAGEVQQYILRWTFPSLLLPVSAPQPPGQSPLEEDRAPVLASPHRPAVPTPRSFKPALISLQIGWIYAYPDPPKCPFISCSFPGGRAVLIQLHWLRWSHGLPPPPMRVCMYWLWVHTAETPGLKQKGKERAVHEEDLTYTHGDRHWPLDTLFLTFKRNGRTYTGRKVYFQIKLLSHGPLMNTHTHTSPDRRCPPANAVWIKLV